MTRSPGLRRWASLLVLGTALTLSANSADAKKEDKKPALIAANPYPSTYKPYPGTPTALVGATVYDGRGGRIDNGVVLFKDGKLVGIGGADMAIPDGFTKIDAAGKFVTPGAVSYTHLTLPTSDLV